MKLSRFVFLVSVLGAAPLATASTVGVTTNPTLDIFWRNGTIQDPPQKYVGQVQFAVDENGDFTVAGSTPAANASCAGATNGQINGEYAFCWGVDQDLITLSPYAAGGNLDPYFTFAPGVIDFGAPSIFTFVFSSPIVPAITGPASYILEIGAKFTSTTGSPGGSIGIAAPNTLGVLEGLVNGTTVIDGTGPAAVFAGPGTVDYGTPSFTATGTYDCSLVGGCTSFQARVSFLGSGGGDAYGFSGRFEITPVPLPAGVWLLGSAVGLLGALRRRMR